jgi:hypothetical protein
LTLPLVWRLSSVPPKSRADVGEIRAAAACRRGGAEESGGYMVQVPVRKSKRLANKADKRQSVVGDVVWRNGMGVGRINETALPGPVVYVMDVSNGRGRGVGGDQVSERTLVSPLPRFDSPPCTIICVIDRHTH